MVTPGGQRRVAVAGLVLLAAVAPIGVASSAAQDDDVCARFDPAVASGVVAEPRLVELSGLAGSRNHSDVLWGHNDSGGAPELFAFAEDGSSLGTYPVEGAEAVDWEDMATGPTPNGRDTVLYVGDIGDNDAARPTVTVYRVYEPGQIPVAPGVPLGEVEAIELRYPGGPSDAEALLIDPRTGDLVIVTKSLVGRSRVLMAEAASLVEGAPVELTDAGPLDVPLWPDAGTGLPGTAVTGGDVSPDGSIAVLRTYRSVLAFGRSEGQSLADALLGEPCFAPQEEEPQGEAIAFTGGGEAYVTASEGSQVPIHRVGLSPLATTTSTATTAPAPAGTDGDDPDDDPDDEGSTTAALVVAGAVVLVVVGAGGVLWARRRRASGPG